LFFSRVEVNAHNVIALDAEPSARLQLDAGTIAPVLTVGDTDLGQLVPLADGPVPQGGCTPISQ